MIFKKALIFLILLSLSACNLPGGQKRAEEKANTLVQTPDFIEPSPVVTPTPIPSPPVSPFLKIDTGEKALNNGEWDKALQAFQSVYDSSEGPPQKNAALYGLGRTFFYAQNYHEAVSKLEELIQNFPTAPEVPQANFFLAQAYNAFEQYDDAADAYLRYLILRPGLIDGYILNLRGDSLFAAGKYSEAANDYQLSLNYPSLIDSTHIQMKIARSYALYGDYPSAIALYDDIYQYTKNDDTLALINYRKGQAYAALGQSDKAMESYLQAVTNFPTSYYSYLSLISFIASLIISLIISFILFLKAYIPKPIKAKNRRFQSIENN